MKLKTPLVNINAKHNNSDGLYDYMKREIERLNDYISFYEDLSKKQNKEIERLKERLNKAINYIEENMDNFEIPWKTVLYDILKGVDKD